MPSDYDQFFDHFEPTAPRNVARKVELPIENQPEPLDDILQKMRDFDEKAVIFSKNLSQLSAIDHKVPNATLAIFFEFGKNQAQPNLISEQNLHALLLEKFRAIIAPMKALAELHVDCLQKFTLHIDDRYYSIEKTAAETNHDRETALHQLFLQRKILADAARDLEILENAMTACERRLKKYIRAGGANNISAAEQALVAQNRQPLTDGREHSFNYAFFAINLIDEVAMKLGFLQKDTTAQFLQKYLTGLDSKN